MKIVYYIIVLSTIFCPFILANDLRGILGEVISEEYSLEYGTDVMEMHVGAVQPGEKVLVIDDLIATGGTLCAAIKLLGIFLILSLKSFKLLFVCSWGSHHFAF